MDTVYEIIDSVAAKIVAAIDPAWDKLQKIRFVYLELGKYLEKNADFFENSKLLNYGYSEDEMAAIYYDDKLYEANRVNARKQYQVICKSAALFLKRTFDKLGIDAEYVHTVGSVDNILHWFIVVKDDAGEQYFLTLAADLPYIKNNFPTVHFGNDIKCLQTTTIKSDGEVKAYNKLEKRLTDMNISLDDVLAYKASDNKVIVIPPSNVRYFKIKDNDIKPINLATEKVDEYVLMMCYYDTLDLSDSIGKEEKTEIVGNIEVSYDVIAHSDLITIGANAKKLEHVDNSIGYGKLYETTNMLTEKELNDLFLIFSEENSEIYHIFRDAFDLNTGSARKLDDITCEQANRFISNLENYICDMLEPYFNTNSKNFKAFIIELLCYLEDVDTIDTNLTLTELLKKYKKRLKEINEPPYDRIFKLIQSVNSIAENFKTFFILKNKIELLEEECLNANYDNERLTSIQEKLEVTVKNYKRVKKDLSIVKMTPLLNRIAFFFIQKELVDVASSEYVSIEYVVNKFRMMFPIVFDCNFEGYETVKFNDFSGQNYSEQIVIVKKLLKKMFPELNEQNSREMENYDTNYSAVENRIRTYPLKNKITGEYCIAFKFGRSVDEDDMDEFVYIPSENLLRKRDAIKDHNLYWVVSQTFNNQINKIESDEIQLDEPTGLSVK